MHPLCVINCTGEFQIIAGYFRINHGKGIGQGGKWAFQGGNWDIIIGTMRRLRAHGGTNENREYQEHAVDWVIGAAALIALVIAIGANRRISNMRDEVSRRIETSLKTAIGVLKADGEENAQLLKRMSDRILKMEKRLVQAQHSDANKKAELRKLRTENKHLRSGGKGKTRDFA